MVSRQVAGLGTDPGNSRIAIAGAVWREKQPGWSCFGLLPMTAQPASVLEPRFEILHAEISSVPQEFDCDTSY
jgi:hypothetical protein